MTLDHLASRAKTIVAVLGGLLTLAVTLDWGAPLPPWVTALAVLATAAGVYAVPNRPITGDGGRNDPPLNLDDHLPEDDVDTLDGGPADHR